MARVYVGIVTYNSRVDLPNCVRALQNQTYQDVQVIVFDNASSDGSAEWLGSTGIKLILNSENIGFGRAHNQLLSCCSLGTDDFYMPLNPDVVLAPNYIAVLVDCMTFHGAGWATGKLLQAEQVETLYSTGHGLRRDGYFFNIGYHQPNPVSYARSCEVFGAPGAASLISARLLADVAPAGELFDSTIFLYGEDTDFDWRARRAGWRCWYAPESVATHRGSTPSPELKIQALANRYLSVIKNAYLIDLITYNLPIIALHLLFRLIVTPHLGLILLDRLRRYGLLMWGKRMTPRMKRSDFLAWCRQPSETAQPSGWGARFVHFISAYHVKAH